MPTPKYYCDLCSTKKVRVNKETNKREVYKDFWSGSVTRDYINHLECNKHLKNEDIDETEQDKRIYCPYCEFYFCKEGWVAHEKRNAEMWRFKDILPNSEFTCNEFKSDGVRFSSFADLRKGIDGIRTEQIKAKRKTLTTEERIDNYKEQGCVIIGGEDYDSEEEFIDMNPHHDGEDFCEECFKPVYISQHTNSDILTKSDKEWLRWNKKKYWCECVYSDEEDEEVVINLLDEDEDVKVL